MFDRLHGQLFVRAEDEKTRREFFKISWNTNKACCREARTCSGVAFLNAGAMQTLSLVILEISQLPPRSKQYEEYGDVKNCRSHSQIRQNRME